jgi:hypothetical protein
MTVERGAWAVLLYDTSPAIGVTAMLMWDSGKVVLTEVQSMPW